MRRLLSLALLASFLAGCLPARSPQTETPASQAVLETAASPGSPQLQEPASISPQPPAPSPAQPASSTASPSAPAAALPPFPVVSFPNLPEPSPIFDSQVELATWQPSGGYQGLDRELPIPLAQTANPEVAAGLTPDQQSFLEANGIVVIHSQEAQFNDIREEVAIRRGQPYYLTSDAAYHALHITFDELLRALEAQYLRPRMIAMVSAALDEVQAYRASLEGTPLANEARLAAAYLAVGLKLFEPDAPIDPDLEALAAPQVEQILAGGGRARSVLFPAFEDDYGAYKPVGHYSGRPSLEAYFRGMTWFGRVHFSLNASDPANPPSRLPLIVTRALRTATMPDGSSVAQTWAELHSLLTFLVGPSDDAGPVEFATLMDEIYGAGASVQELANQAAWDQFLQSPSRLPAPRINSTFIASLNDLPAEKGWRLMGQRFTLDGLIFQNLVFDKVGTPEKPRRLPSGLDVLAAFGSAEALNELEESGEADYANYRSQMSLLQQAVRSQPEAEWLDTFYSAWLYAFFPQLRAKGAEFPQSMRLPAWRYKEMNSVLGSWAELKHDTALYAKMPEMAAGGGPPMSGPAPAYVEPAPDVFFRLGYAARLIGRYLTFQLDFMGAQIDDPPPGEEFPLDLSDYAAGIDELGERFTSLGEIAARQLAGQPLTAEDYDAIQGCLGPVECLVFQYHTPYLGGLPGEEDLELPEVPVVAAVAGAEQDILQVGVGGVDRIYVIVPIAGRLVIAQGGVFSYYEFVQPRADRLTDEQWRQRLVSDPPPQPSWRARFVLPGGEPVDVLAFNIGDIYIITEEGDRLNVRETPSTSARVVHQLSTHDYIEIVGGPQQAGGFTWWEVQSPYDPEWRGWVVQVAEWYKRSTLLEE